MATGIEMMLKSMGVDPEKIKSALTTARDEIMAQVNAINEKLNNIEIKLNLLLENGSVKPDLGRVGGEAERDEKDEFTEGGQLDTPSDYKVQ